MALLAPLFLQNATTPVSYSAQMTRFLIDAVLTSGVCSPGDLKVSPRGAGANMSVDVAAGSVVIPGILGPYICASTAVTNVPLAAAPGSGSRIDLIVATVRDSQATSSGTDSDWIIQPVTGTASGSPAVPATPLYSTVLAHVLVASGTASIGTGLITDFRVAATSPMDRWTTLPAQGRSGQVIGTTDGKSWVWSSGAWQELARVSDVAYGSSDLAGATAAGSFATYGTQITIPAPGRKSLIEAWFSCYVNSANSSAAMGRQSLQISANNGSTWSSPTDKLGLSPNLLSPIPMSDNWQAVTAGSGVIIVRSRIQSDSGSAEFHGGTLTAKVTPVA